MQNVVQNLNGYRVALEFVDELNTFKNGFDNEIRNRVKYIFDLNKVEADEFDKKVNRNFESMSFSELIIKMIKLLKNIVNARNKIPMK